MYLSNEYKRQTPPRTSFLRQVALAALVTYFIVPKCTSNYFIVPKCRNSRRKNPNQYIDTQGKSIMTEQCNSIKDTPQIDILRFLAQLIVP